MNNEELTVISQSTQPLPQDDPQDAPLSQSAAETPECMEGDDTIELYASHQAQEGERGEQALSPDELPQASLQDPDPDLPAAPAQAAPNGLEQLRDELNALRRELQAREAFIARMGNECEEFRSLYPEIPLDTVSDEIWASVRRGVPLAAAYALEERRQHRTAELAAASNRSNKNRSSGALTGNENDYFSPAEVRAMSQAEVHANYQKIMQSMQKWH